MARVDTRPRTPDIEAEKLRAVKDARWVMIQAALASIFKRDTDEKLRHLWRAAHWTWWELERHRQPRRKP